ncbi:protein FAM53C-like [Nerophis ophidion]|uniref:protein FAM53C-like n=1 Tax=Nerophis ophidion TaxID=159077 RepID=UPI002AE00302|nr:protein FAM53C-like [Nerophis ophidion]XP_061758063.1 protein FAM53C-like [Nerophis ophidion]
MVTLITEQLRKQSLEEPYHKAFNGNVTLPALGSSPTISWRACKSTQGKCSGLICCMLRPFSFCRLLAFSESSVPSQPLFKAKPLDATCGLDSTWPCQVGKPHHGAEVSIANKTFQSSPPPPPPKRHCRSLSVPEDLSRCRSTWHPSASKVWTPVERASQSVGTSNVGSGDCLLPLCGRRTFSKSSSLHSSSSPTFFSLALSADSPLPWSFPWDPCESPKTACSSSLATTSSCSSSPTPLSGHLVLHRRYSLSPLQVLNTSMLAQHPRAAHAVGMEGMEGPALSPSPTSACSTPSSSRRDPHPALPRCHSQPCDMRKPRLKRRHDPDVLPGPRPGLDFSKMTQIGNGDVTVATARSHVEKNSAVSPAEFLGRASIRPLSESEEDEDDTIKRTSTSEAQTVFERDCTELDLNLIEEN